MNFSVYFAQKNGSKGYVVDPTIRVETLLTQPVDVYTEKCAIYNPCAHYFKQKYNVEEVEEIVNTSNLIGARGKYHNFS